MDPTRFECSVGTNVWFAVQQKTILGALITDADTTVNVEIRGDHSATPTVDASDVGTVYDSLQTGDSRWKDNCNLETTERGFNFEYTSPLTAFPVSAFYRVTFTFVDGSGNELKHVFEGPAR